MAAESQSRPTPRVPYGQVLISVSYPTSRLVPCVACYNLVSLVIEFSLRRSFLGTAELPCVHPPSRLELDFSDKLWFLSVEKYDQNKKAALRIIIVFLFIAVGCHGFQVFSVSTNCIILENPEFVIKIPIRLGRFGISFQCYICSSSLYTITVTQSLICSTIHYKNNIKIMIPIVLIIMRPQYIQCNLMLLFFGPLVYILLTCHKCSLCFRSPETIISSLQLLKYFGIKMFFSKVMFIFLFTYNLIF